MFGLHRRCAASPNPPEHFSPTWADPFGAAIPINIASLRDCRANIVELICAKTELHPRSLGRDRNCRFRASIDVLSTLCQPHPSVFKTETCTQAVAVSQPRIGASCWRRETTRRHQRARRWSNCAARIGIRFMPTRADEGMALMTQKTWFKGSSRD